MNPLLASATLERILIVAESLFANHGYDGTTLRQITQKAGVNLAAVNYHHGNKEGLYLEILRRRIQPINQIRLARLTEAEARAGGGVVSLDTLMEIMSGPLYELFAHTDEQGRHAARLLGRSLAEPLLFLENFLTDEFQPVMARFGQALRRHVPTLPAEEFLWRLSFVTGALYHSLATLHRMKELTQGICRNQDHGMASRCFVHFATVVFQSTGTSLGREN